MRHLSADAGGVGRRRQLRNRGAARAAGRADPGREHGRRRGTAPPGRRRPARRPMPACRSTPRARSAATVPRRSRRGRRRWPARRPTGPSARLRAASRPQPARPIIEPMAATAKAPLATPRAKTEARSGQPGPTRPAAASAEQHHRRGDAAADASRRAASRAAARRTCSRPAPRAIMPSRTPPCCTPESLVDFAGREAEDQAGEGLEDQVLRAVGQHRDEDEDGEPPRLAAPPRPGPAPRGTAPGGRRGLRWRRPARRARRPRPRAA